MQKKSSAFFYAMLIGFVLYGCGTKGPLYIPEQQYPQATSNDR